MKIVLCGYAKKYAMHFIYTRSFFGRCPSGIRSWQLGRKSLNKCLMECTICPATPVPQLNVNHLPGKRPKSWMLLHLFFAALQLPPHPPGDSFVQLN